MKTNTKLTKKDLFRANWRWLWASQLKNDGTRILLYRSTIFEKVL